MAANWDYQKIEDVAEKVGMGPFGSSIKVETFVPNGIPVVSGQHLHGSRLEEDAGFNFVSEEHADKLKNANVYRGDIIFTHAGNIGNVAYIPENSKFERYIASQRQFYMRCNLKKVLPSFVTYYFKTHEGQHRLKANTSSVGVPSIAQPVSYLRKLEIPVPPLNEQFAIVDVLGALDDKIELNRRMNATLESLARAVFLEVMKDVEEQGSILEFANLLSGGTPSTAEERYWDGNIEWVSAKDVSNANGVFLLDTEKKVTQDGINNSATKLLPAKTVIVTARGTVGAHCMLGKPMTMNQTNYGLKAKEGIGDYFVYFTLSDMVEQLKQQSYGTIFDTITTKTFQNALCAQPSVEVIQRFENQVTPMMDAILNNQNESRTLASLRDSLLPKLMRGEVRVKDVRIC